MDSARLRRYRSIFSPSTRRERETNFDDYWRYTLERDGEIFEADKDLAKKNMRISQYRGRHVRSRRPLQDPEAFYRNYVVMKDDPRSLDAKTRLLTLLYKFARHEWVGISAAWDSVPPIAQSKHTRHRISRYHLCEEFCHVRLFHEMFRTFHLEHVEWVPLGKWMSRSYRVFALLPTRLTAPAAFVSELMGLTLYLQIDQLLDNTLDDEPEARDHVRTLLREITTDELAHVGQRRNFLGPVGLRIARWMIRPMYKLFFWHLPEAHLVLDVDRMIRDSLTFDYSIVSPDVLNQSWVPAECIAESDAA